MTSVRKRPTLWSYLSFERGSTRHDRSSSITSQLRPADAERYEKNKDSSSSQPVPPSSQQSAMTTKWVRVLGLLAVFGILLIVFRPSGTPSIHHGGGQKASDPTVGTDKCTVSSAKHKPIVQYALMVDAGSTGSRIHVYRFNNCGDTPELEGEEFKMIKGGLSSYPDDPEGAARSLDELLEVAVKTVPEKLKACTPIAVKATAGLRLLGQEKSTRILKAVRNRLETKYPFAVVQSEDGVSIMDGKDEGVYAWITTNYLLGKIGTVEKIPTAAVFDLGGGSTQIVFQPTFPKIGGGMPETLTEGDHKYELNFGGRDFDLYQHSHLGLGLMEARKSIHKAVLQSRLDDEKDPWTASKGPIMNPCINVGQWREIELDMAGTMVKVNMTGPSEPAFPQCRALAEKILNKGADCKLTPCSFNGIHQPPLARTFAREDVYIFSYFYDRLEPLGMPESFTLREVMDVARKVCGGTKSWDIFHTFPTAMEELEDRPEYCLDLSFMFALLHTGYEMPIDREVKTAKKIRGNELGWCLGASLPLLDQGSGGWQCRIKEIP
ncbi:hypothetical protein EX30DRAFT_325629 [Ascodesmis nigricans]|uniref:guanosine-diphosphatase n=1 Tax=Ascodesmis nigricans TaxID=341454 RepID=A0A4S2N669_9PEZI|nr:hypothetical protein EX30DRAFT_325629 [Ascodesmis nigricans]